MRLRVTEKLIMISVVVLAGFSSWIVFSQWDKEKDSKIDEAYTKLQRKEVPPKKAETSVHEINRTSGLQHSEPPARRMDEFNFQELQREVQNGSARVADLSMSVGGSGSGDEETTTGFSTTEAMTITYLTTEGNTTAAACPVCPENSDCVDPDIGCICNDGYANDTLQCNDINECRDPGGTNDCDANANCTNTNGSYICTCNNGYTGNGTRCNDINECGDPGVTNDCDANANCTNTIGSYICTCNNGYTKNGTRCNDVDECDSVCNTDGAVCINWDGSYNCTCDNGYQLDPVAENCTKVCPTSCPENSECLDPYLDCICVDGFENIGNGTLECADVNECEFTCNTNWTVCVNTDGSYNCTCEDGYQFDAVEENCTKVCPVCPQNSYCLNPYVGCTCLDGFENTGNDTLKCDDVNECEFKCDTEGTVCNNTDGSYNCTCIDGYLLDPVGENCTKVCPSDCPESSYCFDPYLGCICVDGYESTSSDTLDCEDIDECMENYCHVNANCINTNGSYNCICNDGYSGNGIYCSDIDECNEYVCHIDSLCLNTDGSFNCSCYAGYIGDGTNCTDVDECTENVCDVDANCTNTKGSYYCKCNDGYSGNGTYCEDVDECLSSVCHLDAECNNTNGSYYCSCYAGYTGDGVNCTDMNECALKCNTEGTVCNNTDGSYNCTCKDGYQLDPIAENCTKVCPAMCPQYSDCWDPYVGCTCLDGFENTGKDPLQCDDIDECLKDLCPDDSTCTNIAGSFNCSCKNGFLWNGTHCSDIDECLEMVCHVDANCSNTPGSYDCTCISGYTGDENSCNDINECDAVNDCHVNAECANTNGSYTCACNIGYSGDGNECDDIDECEESDCHDDADCANTMGSYVCTCKTGYTGDGFDCIDVDECTFRCKSAGLECENTVGSYVCSCMDGYRYEENEGLCVKVCPDSCLGNSVCTDPYEECVCKGGFEDSGTETQLICDDIDECGTECNDANENRVCVNTVGSYTCFCEGAYFENVEGNCEEVPAGCSDVECTYSNSTCTDSSGTCTCMTGWEGEPNSQCTDIDECDEQCFDATESCMNNEGSFTCGCIDGFIKNGEKCEPSVCRAFEVDCGDAPDELCADSGGSINFPETLCGYSVSSESTCDSTGAPYGTRTCNLDCTWGAIKWLSSCDTNLEELTGMAPENITEEEREQVATDLEVLTSDPEELTSANVADTVVVLDTVTKTEELSPEVSESVVLTVGNLMESPESVAESGQSEEILDTLDTVGTNVNLMEGETFEETSEDLSMVVLERESGAGGQGMLVLESVNGSFREDQFVLVEDDDLAVGQRYEGRRVNSRVFLSKELLDSVEASRVSFLTFGNDVLFQTGSTSSQRKVRTTTRVDDEEEEWNINSLIISVGLPGVSLDMELSDVNMSFTLKAILNVIGPCEMSDLVRCVWWNTTNWTSDLVDTVSISQTEVTCAPRRLGDVAVAVRNVCHITVESCDALNIPVITGCSITILILTSYFVVVAIFPSSFGGVRFRSAYSIVNLVLAMLGANAVMLAQSLVTTKSSCRGVAASLHVFLLAIFALLNNEVVNLFVTLVKVLWVQKRILREVLIPLTVFWGYFIPVLLVLIASLQDGSVYGGYYDTCQVCWVDQDIAKFFVLTPFCILFGTTIIIYAIILYNLLRHKSDTKLFTGCSTFDLWMNLIVHVIFSLVVAITWVFGLKVITLQGQKPDVFSYLFAAFDIAQGILILYFFVGRNTNLFKSYLSLTYKEDSPYAKEQNSYENPYSERVNEQRVEPAHAQHDLKEAFTTDLDKFTGLPRATIHHNRSTSY